MKIKKVEIENFGKLKNKSVIFEDGIQILYGENEKGKSTLMEFIKIMFYGDMGRNINSSIREGRYPWGNGKLGGILEFEDNNKLYKIQKEFDKKTPLKDKVLFKCVSDSQEISLGKKEEIGKRILGLSLEDFERSGYINCLGEGPFSSGKSSKDMMLNLMNTGDENISKELSEEHLDRAIKDLKWKNNLGGRVILLNKEIIKLQELLFERKKVEEEQYKIKKQIYEIENLIEQKSNLKNTLNNISICNKLKSLNQLLQLLKERKLLRRDIKKNFSSYGEAKQKLYECSEIYQKIKGTQKDIDNLTEELENYTDVNILEEELNNIKELISQRNKMDSIISDIDNIHIFEAENFINNKKSYEEKINKICSLKNKLKDLESKVNKYDILKNRKSQLELENDFINTDIIKKNSKIEKYEQNLYLNTEKYKTKLKYIYTISFIILFLFVNLFIFNKMIFSILFFGIFIISIIYIIIYNLELKKINNEYKSEIYFLKNDMKESVIKKDKNFKNIVELDKEINNLFYFFQEHSQINIYINNSDLEMKIDKINLENEGKKLNRNINNILDKVNLDNKNLKGPNIYKKFLILSQKIKNIREKIEYIIKTKLRDKKCKSEEEFFEKYNKCLKCEGLKKLIKCKEAYVKQKKNSFINIMKFFGYDTSFQTSVNKFKDLYNLLNEEIIKNMNIQTFVKTLNLDSENITYIENMVLKIEKSISNNNNTHIDYEDAENKIKNLESQNLEKKLDELKNKIVIFHETTEQIKEKLDNKKCELKNKEIYLASLELAKFLINESYKELKNEIGPKIDNRTSEIFKDLTSGKYNTLFVQNDFSIFIKTDIFDRKYNLFSSGTVDQAYFSLRLALSEIISKNTCIPLILDDILVRYDDNRLFNTLKYLKRYSLEHKAQIIIFTCHNYMIQMGNKLEITSYKLI